MNTFVSTLGLALLISTLPVSAQKKTTPETALMQYINNGDAHYAYAVKDSGKLGSTRTYHLNLTSQQWKGITWRHQLSVFIPSQVDYSGALLIISGGSNTSEQPNWSASDRMWPVAAQIAESNKSVVAILKQTPNQPLMDGRKEDALISHTLHQFKQDGQYDWPLLFPMVKSALRSMDAIQDLTITRSNKPVHEFMIAGASKRGWTTWLSAATGDNRIKAIAPMVIDMLNMPLSLNAQLKAYGKYSEQIEDYVKLEIPQTTSSKKGKAVTTMIDPYSYKHRYTIPKMIFIGTNDEYWTVDAIKWYINDLPGETMIHYVPNAGHDLGGGAQALQTLSAFYGKMLQQASYPLLKNNATVQEKKFIIEIEGPSPELQEVALWTANSTDQDFRNEKWSSTSVNGNGNKRIIEIPLPDTGFKACYIDFKYKGPQGPYSSSSRVYVLSAKGVE
ncbi:MAG: PhoPQ-activated pathogenicity-related family protein [Bacteroidota bacterium]